LEHGVDFTENIDYLDMRHVIIASDQEKMAKGGYTFYFLVNFMKVSDVLFKRNRERRFWIIDFERLNHLIFHDHLSAKGMMIISF
jgi:hypothetical protein